MYWGLPIIFEKSFNENVTFQEIIDGAQECELVKINGFAGSLLKLVEDNFSEIDEIILENLVGWTLQRLPKVTPAILRLAVAEIMFNADVPTSVSVNEAVELAKTYATTEDASYINGVLSSIVKKNKWAYI